MYLKFVAAEMFFDDLHFVTATGSSRLTMFRLPFVGLLRDCLYRKLLKHGQFSDTLNTSYPFDIHTLQVIRSCKDW